MEKPIIFFSHSTKDRDVLMILKEIILIKTNNAVEIFLSSDGQSIPFGKNWVNKIEEALKNTKLLFVFLTPNSILSNWVYFEAGHAYSKERNVIPIGLFGIDLLNISPPLSLLQGFNITDKNGLSNIISIINKEFKLTCNDGFSEEEFNRLLISNTSFEANLFTSVFNKVVLNFPPELKEEFNNKILSPDFLFDFKQLIQKCFPEHVHLGNFLMFEGAALRTLNLVNGISSHQLEIDPLSLPSSIDIIKQCIPLAYNTNEFSMELSFHPNIFCFTDLQNLSSRLLKYDFHFTNKNALQFENIIFFIDDARTSRAENKFLLNIHFIIEELNFQTVNKLVNILFDANVCIIN